MIKGRPKSLELHGIKFERDNLSFYTSTFGTGKDHIAVRLASDDEAGYWVCTFSLATHEFDATSDPRKIMESSSHCSGCSINPADAVELALISFQRMTVAVAAAANRIGLFHPEAAAEDTQ